MFIERRVVGLTASPSGSGTALICIAAFLLLVSQQVIADGLTDGTELKPEDFQQNETGPLVQALLPPEIREKRHLHKKWGYGGGCNTCGGGGYGGGGYGGGGYGGGGYPQYGGGGGGCGYGGCGGGYHQPNYCPSCGGGGGGGSYAQASSYASAGSWGKK